jgi:hypothetical protein
MQHCSGFATSSELLYLLENYLGYNKKKKLNSVVLVRKRTMGYNTNLIFGAKVAQSV